MAHHKFTDIVGEIDEDRRTRIDAIKQEASADAVAFNLAEHSSRTSRRYCSAMSPALAITRWVFRRSCTGVRRPARVCSGTCV